jgi:hypothetical protein
MMMRFWTCAAIMGLATPADGPKRVDFQPGVVIDWSRRQVEVDCTVVLREGLLELVACTANSREHEALLRVNARAMHIYMALGLLGLEPGKPAAWDFDKDQPIPATGGAVSVSVRFERNGQAVEQNVRHWLLEKGQVMRERHWVFAGSVPTKDGDLVAQREGTIVTVVDFGDALLGLPENHTADNEELWLEPNTEAIPELGAGVTLILRALAPPALVVTLDEKDRWHWSGKVSGFDQLVNSVFEKAKGDQSAVIVVKVPVHKEPAAQRLHSALTKRGVVASRIRVETVPQGEKGKPR